MKDFTLIPFTSGSFPDVTADQSSGSTVRDGAPLHADWVNELWGAFQALLDAADVTPSGSSESSSASDILDSVRKISGAPGEIVFWGGRDSSFSAHANRLLALTGQVITITDYPELAAAVYVGDGYNYTFPAFYKTSDAGGTNRSTSGAYMVMPDCRGQFLRGLNGARSTGTYDLGRTATGDAGEPGSVQDYQSGVHNHAVGWTASGLNLKKLGNETIHAFNVAQPLVGSGTTQYDILERTGTALTSPASPGDCETLNDGDNHTYPLDLETRPINLAFHVMIRY